MLNLPFAGFITLLVVALVVSLVMHYVFHVRAGVRALDVVVQVIAAYVGAWLGPVLLGSGWFPGDTVAGVAYVPAILGALAAHTALVWTMESQARAAGGAADQHKGKMAG
ncbi:MAG: hypothetical protein IRY95_04795 [Clostridia bacterium]|nr:hypothetical protein [Clostridia bacterium]